MGKRLGVRALAVMMCLASCAPAGDLGETGETARVFYAADVQDGAGEVIDSLLLPVPAGTEDILRFSLEKALQSPPEDDRSLRGAFPEGTELLRMEFDGYQLTIDLSAPYGILSGPALTIADACLTLTAAQDRRVSHVRILADGLPHPEREDRYYTASDIVLSDKPQAATERDITLYFADETGRYLRPEARKIVIREQETAARYVWEELARGPQTEGHFPVIPEGVRLLSVTVQERLCTLSLSASFMEKLPAGAIAQRTTLCAIVNSLAALPDVERVALLAEGAPVAIWGHWSLTEAMLPDENAIGPPADNEEDVTLYYPNAMNTRVIPVPARIPKEIQPAAPGKAALEALFTRTPPPGSQSPVPAGGRILSYTVENGVCTLDVNRAFLDNHAGGSSGETMTLACVVNTLTAFEDIRRVQLLIEGERRQHFVQTVIYDPLPPMTELIAE